MTAGEMITTVMAARKAAGLALTFAIPDRGDPLPAIRRMRRRNARGLSRPRPTVGGAWRRRRDEGRHQAIQQD